MFIHGPSIHLKRCIATISCKAHNMVFAIIHRGALFFDGDIYSANVEDHTDLALLLKRNK